jgi:nucleotide-binding universal stress UspA family protein
MLKRILYPTDFSDVSKKALSYIKQLKEGGSKEVIVLHVVDERGMEAIDRYSPVDSAKFQKDIVEGAEQEMGSVKKELSGYGFEVKTLVRIGMPVREILKAEKDEDVSLIVLGSHGKSNLEEMFLGSVSEKVARKCKKPILIVKR